MSDLEDLLAFQMIAVGCPLPDREYHFSQDRDYRFDFCWPKIMLAVEVQGGTWANGKHSRGSGVEKDYEKLNTAQLLGWTVLQFSTDQVKDGRAVTVIEQAIRVTA